MRNFQQEAQMNKLLSGTPQTPTDFSKLSVGARTLTDAVISSLGDLKKANSRLANKQTVLQAIANNDLATMQEVSNQFFRTSGIYSRLCRHLAYLYRYDFLVTPYFDKDSGEDKKVIPAFNSALKFLDAFGVKRTFGDVCLKVIKNGCYYCYVVETEDSAVLQELPATYCRTRYSVKGRPVVEFLMKFFDDNFRDEEYRKKILKMFPTDFARGYKLYKAGKLKPEQLGEAEGWYVLDTDKAFKFNINGEDSPFLISTIPAIIDLDAAQDLDRQKMAQQILKILVQNVPYNKNGDPIFDQDEARQLHNNAVTMLNRTIGMDVLTTFLDVHVEDLADSNSTTTTDELEKVERTVYNESGTAQNLFNTDGNIALEKSILNDEAAMYNLLLQFEQFLNVLIQKFNKGKKLYFKVQMLTTTIYNYKDMSKLYKEQTQLGYSKMLPQVALGQSQSSVLANAHFENDILDLVHVFIPPMMSSTMNGDTLAAMGKKNQTIGDGQVGRKELPDDEKSEKTLANRESMS